MALHFNERPDGERVPVKFPNLFRSFLKSKPELNPLYETTRKPSEEAVCRECEVDGHVAKAIVKCDFSFFAAVMAPHAGEDRFRTICDWPFDDLFDIGCMRDDYEDASATIGQLLQGFVPCMKDDSGQKPSIVAFHDSIWAPIKSAAPRNVQSRYQKTMSDYCTGALNQVLQVGAQQVPSVETMLELRRSSVCVSTLFVLVEYGHRLNLPDQVFSSPEIQKLERAGIGLTLMHNDILSYHREETESVLHNLVAIARMQGVSAQAAFDCIARMIEQRHELLDQAIDSMPPWDARTDTEVARYVAAVKDVVKANLYWSFRSGRFLSETQKIQVKHDGVLYVLARPSFLKAVKAGDAAPLSVDDHATKETDITITVSNVEVGSRL